ncbi:GDSL-type esterase/lipase family protein [Rubinisphaera margarita]|uniref:GDSL-type esterase/lipase family protein n=1 Tax=Rubinisphaera margarita TaxID=2909586 RepID=UPI001EE7F715|nr:GDSL-type esterase/lipase family protein [Rubinisphaera margarita]MCG6157780.1 GDSL-type esterase/lipase family protein [Rubinisphaera margarita]
MQLCEIPPARSARRLCCLALLAITLGIPHVSEAADANWQLKDGDRVVLLGSTFIERENAHGVVEMSLRLAAPNVDFTVRNLGWSGDNVLGESRAYFGPVQAGYAHLQEYIGLTKPTVLIVSYGHNAAFAGEAGLTEFLGNYSKLLKDLSADGRRLVVLGPTPLEPVVQSPEQIEQLNKNRRLYSDSIRTLCEKQNCTYVDLLEPMQTLRNEMDVDRLTENGIHLNRDGYIAVGEILARSLGTSLIRDGEPLLRDSQFAAAARPAYEAILWKNELFFHRFRPQNETYLRGFRKHEQGQNAKEILEFDPLVQEQDQAVQKAADELIRNWGPAN